MNTKDLDGLREKIENIDREIIDLIAQRLGIVLEIGTVKSSMKIPIRDYRVEREVIRRMQNRCSELDIDPSVGRLLARLLIESAVRAQEEIIERIYGGTLMQVLVLGGHGKMGRWFCNYLNSMGHQVVVVDPAGPVEGYNYEENLEQAAGKTDMILLSTPLGKSKDALEELISIRPEGIIFDICSLKSHLLEPISKAVSDGIKITSLHPMFGPEVMTLMDRNVILCRCGCPEADQKVKLLFEGTEANLLELDIEEHDDRMAYVLGMSHALNIMFSETLVRSGKSLHDLMNVGSSTFLKQIETTRDVAFESAELYYEIQALNNHTPAVFELFLQSVREVQSLVLERNLDRFREIMERGQEYFRVSEP
jgi:chorismate mutase/prephenate dehydrogenase